jgi:hypothetical protein
LHQVMLVGLNEKDQTDMTQRSISQFAHRINDDDTVDSICRDCFVTVATESSESDLERDERYHSCDPALIKYYKNVCVERKFYPAICLF